VCTIDIFGNSSTAFIPETTMDELLKEALGTVTLKKTGKGGGGCINEGEAYLIDTGTVFVKYNKKPQVN
jgi:fructosamine-3-kinase